MRNSDALKVLGWKVIVVWECDVRDGNDWLGNVMATIQRR